MVFVENLSGKKKLLDKKKSRHESKHFWRNKDDDIYAKGKIARVTRNQIDASSTIERTLC